MLTIQNLTIQFEHTCAVNNISFELSKGEISCLLGPSGCGKTTLLRAVAGFDLVNAGQIILDGEVVSSHKKIIAPEKRLVGMVFQDLALFPHLSIADNIRFGIRTWSESRQRTRIKDMLALIEMLGFEDRYPHELSGGQQQRIAIARALAPKPKLLLLDEPFSSLDIDLRQELVMEVKTILQAENITALMVTHDQSEAFSIADHIGIMKKGNLLQWDKPYSIYHQPKSTFIAEFIGEGVLLDGTITNDKRIKTSLMTFDGIIPKDCEVGDSVEVLIRPDDIVHDDCSAMSGTIINKIFRGSNYLYVLQMEDGVKLLSMVNSHHNHQIGEKLGIVLELAHLVVFDSKVR